jgi:hypothetical protein
MNVDGYSFVKVCEILPNVDDCSRVLKFQPQSRYKKQHTVPLNRYGGGPFCRFRIPVTHKVSGVYILTVDGDQKYVGECRNLTARYNSGYGQISPKNCFVGGQETNCRLNSLICEAFEHGRRIALWFHPTNDYKNIEKELRKAHEWAWNKA